MSAGTDARIALAWRAAARVNLTPNDRLVLLAVAELDLNAGASLTGIARRSGFAESTLRSKLAGLQRNGWVEPLHGGPSSWTLGRIVFAEAATS